MSSDPALDVLLDLNDENLEQDGGYWIRIEARLVKASHAIPHGLRYSLTLHNQYGKRVLGYDNAHAVKPPNKYAGHLKAFDHKHRHVSDHGIPYEFTTAQQLLNDFLADVNRILREVKE